MAALADRLRLRVQQLPLPTATEAVVLGANTYTLTLSAVAGIEQITVGSPITNMTWTGQTNGTGAANSVWSATPAGNNNFADTTPVEYGVGLRLRRPHE